MVHNGPRCASPLHLQCTALSFLQLFVDPGDMRLLGVSGNVMGFEIKTYCATLWSHNIRPIQNIFSVVQGCESCESLYVPHKFVATNWTGWYSLHKVDKSVDHIINMYQDVATTLGYTKIEVHSDHMFCDFLWILQNLESSLSWPRASQSVRKFSMLSISLSTWSFGSQLVLVLSLQRIQENPVTCARVCSKYSFSAWRCDTANITVLEWVQQNKTTRITATKAPAITLRSIPFCIFQPLLLNWCSESRTTMVSGISTGSGLSNLEKAKTENIIGKTGKTNIPIISHHIMTKSTKGT